MSSNWNGGIQLGLKFKASDVSEYEDAEHSEHNSIVLLTAAN